MDMSRKVKLFMEQLDNAGMILGTGVARKDEKHCPYCGCRPTKPDQDGLCRSRHTAANKALKNTMQTMIPGVPR